MASSSPVTPLQSHADDAAALAAATLRYEKAGVAPKPKTKGTADSENGGGGGGGGDGGDGGDDDDHCDVSYLRWKGCSRLVKRRKPLKCS